MSVYHEMLLNYLEILTRLLKSYLRSFSTFRLLDRFIIFVNALLIFHISFIRLKSKKYYKEQRTISFIVVSKKVKLRYKNQRKYTCNQGENVL